MEDKKIESTKLCLDNAIKKLRKGESPNSSLYQACIQLANYCKRKSKEYNKYAKDFEKKAKVIKKL